MLRVLIFLLLLLGEAGAIYSELLIVKYPRQWLQACVVITLAGFPLLLAYWLSTKTSGSTWVMAVASIAAIALVEPVLLCLWLKQYPDAQLVLASVLVLLGFILAVTA